MADIFHSHLTDTEIQHINQNLSKKINISDEQECHIWTGQRRNKGYGLHELRFRGRKIKVTVHRLIYYIHYKCVNIPPHLHISHLCHNKLCVRVEHLSLEPPNINNKRQICKNEGQCTGHYGFANCILI